MISDSTLAKDSDPSDMGDSDPDLCPVPTWHGTKMAFILAAVSESQTYGIAPDATCSNSFRICC